MCAGFAFFYTPSAEYIASLFNQLVAELTLPMVVVIVPNPSKDAGCRITNTDIEKKNKKFFMFHFIVPNLVSFME